MSQYTWDSCNSTNNNVVFIFVSNLKIAYYNNYQSSITSLWTREEKMFGDKIIQNCLKTDATH